MIKRWAGTLIGLALLVAAAPVLAETSGGNDEWASAAEVPALAWSANDAGILIGALGLARIEPAEAAQDDETAAPEPIEPTMSPDTSFAAGTWTSRFYGSVTFGDQATQLYRAHVGFGYHVIDNLSINAEVNFGYADFRNDDSAIGGLDLMLSWHFLRGENWSVFADGGLGFIVSGDDFGDNGDPFNFCQQIGIGTTWQFAEDCSLISGGRFIHISNAGITDNNANFNGGLGYLGVRIGF